MKTSFVKFISTKTIGILLLITVICLGCSKEDSEPSEFVTVRDTDISFTDINTCHAGGGIYYTQFFFAVTYETSPNIEIQKITYSTMVEGTTTTLPQEKYSFDNDGQKINFSLCLKFGNAPYIDFSILLTSVDGIQSNNKTVRINRPQNAN
jgi:hypothetical protein